ncbi:CheR family methyltransferase [Pseudocolwellia agarivorans]|jgi:chemotaxis protein methyltransferase CheR|uniref:CheR family methyltransferase n=1 Tax=Pseudocolwellia agarivorans TaxID=1911682 RepID=UPI003F8807E6
MTDSRETKQKLSDDDFDFVCNYVYQKSRIVLSDTKREMVYRRFTRIIRDRHLESFSDYCQLLRSDPDGEERYFINAVTTNLTSFFREEHHFDYLAQHELPNLIKKGSKRMRIWCSASSTGEEPYSIAMTVKESLKSLLNSWDVKILATDIDSNVLNTGKEGIYEYKGVEDIPEHLVKKYFSRGMGINSNKVKTTPDIQSLITFKELNLMNEWPMKGPFDVIFCRNVLIYFDKKTQLELFERFHNLLAPNGLLILGHSENLGVFQQHFENVGRTIFRKLN